MTAPAADVHQNDLDDVIAYVNGERSSGDTSQNPLRAHELIQLDVGDETPPQPFTFSPGL